MAHDSLLTALQDGKQGGGIQGLGGIRPANYAGSSTTSQLHAQGANTEDPNPTTNKQAQATNLNFKSAAGHSKHDLDGLTPEKYIDHPRD